MAGSGNVGMKARGNEHGVAIADDGDELGILRVAVDELNAVGGGGHVEVDVYFFEHGGMLVRRPTGPVARIGLRDAGDEGGGFGIFFGAALSGGRGGRAGRGGNASGGFWGFRGA